VIPGTFVAMVAGLIVLMAATAGRPAARRAEPTAYPTDGDRGRHHGQRGDAALGHAIAVLEQLARDLRAGTGFGAALPHALAEQPTVLAGLRTALQRGAPVGEAMTQAATDAAGRVPTDATEVLVLQTLRAAHAAGGNGVDALDRAAAVARERRAWRHERHAQSAQARLSARLLTLLPPLFAGWGIAADERVRAAFAASPLPAACVMCGLALNLVGWWWMRRLVRGG